MPDIRSFFGGRAGEGTGSSQEKPMAKDAALTAKPESRGKRKVLSDSDDDVQEQMSKTTTPKKPMTKKQMTRELPVGEVTTTSDYFASSGKSKPARSTPTKPKASSEKKTTSIPSQPAFGKTPPQDTIKSAAEQSNGSRKSSRKKTNPTYVALDAEGKEEDGDIDNGLGPKVIREDDEFEDDIFGAAYKKGTVGIKDEYDSDKEDVLLPARIITKNGKGSSTIKKHEATDDEFELMHVEPEPRETKTAQSSKEKKTLRGRKRKSAELDEDEHEEEDFVLTKKLNGIKANFSAKKNTTKNRKVPASKEGTPVRTAVDDILDTIPTVRPPTPPPPSDSKKFNFHASAGARAQPPPAAGSKELPIGAENCLAGLTFVFTGILDALGREEGQELVKRYGGKVTTTPSGKTSYVVLGNDAGPKKLETIAKHKLKTIDEDGLFELIRRLPAHGGDGKAADQYQERQRKEEKKIEDQAKEMAEQERTEAKQRAKSATVKSSTKANSQSNSSDISDIDSRLWTVKYAPTATTMICGNKGQVEKLQAWLRAWPSNARTQFKKAGKDGHGVYRAMMLHGPPGIGKTTAAHLAAKLEGYDIVESNASDTRSKKLVETGLKGVLDTTSLLGYFAGDGKQVDADKKKLVLIMDEVDGMSAGDRGGVGALAAVCKKTNIPMILICNDRKLPKMRPFDNVTYDLPFRRPTVDQIRSRIMTICYRENLKVPPQVINALIEGSRSDIRQVINMLSTAKLDQEAVNFDQGKQMSKSWEKHVILKPWDIVSKILGGGMFASSSKATLNDKIELYFNDHEFSSLMLQENYLGTNPILSQAYSGQEKNLKLLELTDKAAESISDGDLVDRMIHGSQQQWSLMPTHAVFSFVRPASFVSGSQAGNQTRFTSWLGNNSKQGKLIRFVKEIQGHMRLRASGDRHEIRQQYLPLLWYRLVKELEVKGKEGIGGIIELMDSYFLTKDDWDAILELGVGPMDEKLISVPTQTKIAFTRTYNLCSHPLPFMKAGSIVAPKAKRDKPDLEEALDDLDEGDEVLDDDVDEDLDEDDKPLDLKKDKYVKAPKKKAKSAPKKASAKEKGKGKVKHESDEGLDDDGMSEEHSKPAKGKGIAKGKGSFSNTTAQYSPSIGRMASEPRRRTEQEMMQDEVAFFTVKEAHRHDVCRHSSPGRFPFGFIKTRKTAQADEGPIKAASTDHNTSRSAPAFRTLETTTRGRRAMRTFNDLSLARKRYHESIGHDDSRFPEGHSQVEYPKRASRKSSRTRSAPPERILPSTQVATSTDPVKKDTPIAEPGSIAQKLSPLIKMMHRPQQASASRYINRSGKHVEGYETHCSSSETQKNKQRPQDIVTRKSWQKVWPTVIEHNPTTPDQAETARGDASRDSKVEGAGKVRDA